jgi:hypothetical protein
MQDERDTRSDDEELEDLDVPDKDAADVKGGMSPDEIKEKILKDGGSK